MTNRAAAWLKCCVVGLWLSACGASQGPGAQSAEPALPPLPQTALAAMPVQAEAVVALDLAKLRGTQPGAIVGRARERSCFASPAFTALWNGTEGVAFSSGEDQQQWALALHGPAVTVASVVEALRELGLLTGAPQAFGAGRVGGQQFGDLVVAELGASTVMAAPGPQAVALARDYDGVARYRPSGEIGLPIGLANLWDRTGEVSKPMLRSIPTQATRSAAGAPIGLRADADENGLSAQARALLATPDEAQRVVESVSGQLRSAALMFRLLGLPPLHNRLQGQTAGSSVEFDVHIRPDESSRLLRLMEDQVHKELSAYCRRLATHSAQGRL